MSILGHLDDLAEEAVAAAAGVPPDMPAIRQRMKRRRWRRRVGALGGVIALGLTAIVGFDQLTDGDDPRISTVDNPAPSSVPTSESLSNQTGDELPDVVEPLAGAPDISPFSGSPAIVWTGEAFIIWGGGQELALSLRPGEDPEPIADAPIAPSVEPGAVRFGDAVFIWGGLPARSDGAIYWPAEDRWDQIPPAPISGRKPLAAIWTGSEIVVFGGNRSFGQQALMQGAAYNPATQRWRRISDAPAPVNLGNGVWTGTELVIVGSHLADNNAAKADTAAMAYDPETDSWRMLPPPGLFPQSMWVEYADGNLYAWDYELNAATLSPSASSWERLPPIPLDFSECYVDGATVGASVLMNHCGDGAILDTATKTWTPVRLRESSTAPVAIPKHIVLFTDDGAFVLLAE